MNRPRILLVPTLTELEWTIRPLIEEWADVASFDAPGVGSEPAVGGSPLEATARRGLEELDRRGWPRAVVVGDEFGSLHALLLAAMRPEAVAALALGHACLRYSHAGDHPTLSHELAQLQGMLASADFRTYVEQLTRAFDPEDPRGRLDPELASSFTERVPQAAAAAYWRSLLEGDGPAAASLEPTLQALDAPLLLAHHQDCLLWTDYGFAEASAAFPEAARFSNPTKPSISPDFNRSLRAFCAVLPE